jgi:hypothetical protein
LKLNDGVLLSILLQFCFQIQVAPLQLGHANASCEITPARTARFHAEANPLVSKGSRVGPGHLKLSGVLPLPDADDRAVSIDWSIQDGTAAALLHLSPQPEPFMSPPPRNVFHQKCSLDPTSGGLSGPGYRRHAAGIGAVGAQPGVGRTRGVASRGGGHHPGGAGHPGGALQLDPIKPMLQPPGTRHLKLKCDILL